MISDATPKHAVLYGRFSPRPNSESCESVEHQLQDLREWCGKRGIIVRSEHFDKAASGGDRDRQGLLDAVVACQKGDVLLVRDWERFARDGVFAGMLLDQLKKRGVEVRSITEQGDMPETSETRLVRDILLRVAEYRRELIAAQTRAGHLKHMANGRSISRYAPYGKRFGPEAHIADRSGKFQVRKTLVDDDEEIQMAERIRMLHFEGSMGFSEIERQLNNEGLTCRNKPWHRAMIKKICKRAEA